MARSRMDWFPFFPGDFWQSPAVRAMDDREVRVYLQLLCDAWGSSGKLRDDDRRLARMVGLSLEEWQEILEGPVGECWQRDGKHFWNPRLLEEWVEAESKVDAARTNGKRGGRPKKASKRPAETESETQPETQSETQAITGTETQGESGSEPRPKARRKLTPHHTTPHPTAAAVSEPPGDSTVSARGRAPAAPAVPAAAPDAAAARDPDPEDPDRGPVELVLDGFGLRAVDRELGELWFEACSSRRLDPVRSAAEARTIADREAPGRATGWLVSGIRAGWLIDRVDLDEASTESEGAALVRLESERKAKDLEAQRRRRAEAEEAWKREQEAGALPSFGAALERVRAEREAGSGTDPSPKSESPSP